MGDSNIAHASGRPTWLVIPELELLLKIDAPLDFCEITQIFFNNNTHESIVYEKGVGLLVHTDEVVFNAYLSLNLSTLSNSSIAIPFNLSMCGKEHIFQDKPEETITVKYNYSRVPYEITQKEYWGYFWTDQVGCPILSVQLLLKRGDEYLEEAFVIEKKLIAYVDPLTKSVFWTSKELRSNHEFSDFYFRAKSSAKTAYKRMIIVFEDEAALPETGIQIDLQEP